MNHTTTATAAANQVAIPSNISAAAIFPSNTLTAAKSRLDELAERIARLKSRPLFVTEKELPGGQTPPASAPPTKTAIAKAAKADGKVIALHGCYRFGWETKPERCGCDVFISQEDADHLVQMGEASWYSFEQARGNATATLTSHKTLILRVTFEERELQFEAEEQARLKSLHDKQQAMREATFAKKMAYVCRQFRKLAFAAGVHYIAEDSAIVVALDDPQGLLGGLVPEHRIGGGFLSLLGLYWNYKLDLHDLHESGNHVPGEHVEHRQNISVPASTGKGDRPKGADFRFRLGYGTVGSDKGSIAALEPYGVDSNGARIIPPSGRLKPMGAGIDGDKAPRTDGGEPEPTAPPEGVPDKLASLLTASEKAALLGLRETSVCATDHVKLVKGLKGFQSAICPGCGQEVYPAG